MNFEIEKSCQVLERTPAVLSLLLAGLDEDWVMNNEGPETFSPYDVIGHLIYGEKTDWVVRVKIILAHGTGKPFESWNRFAQFEESKGKTLRQLLEEFEGLRKDNLRWLRSQPLPPADLDKKGIHPELGEVTLRNLLSTWVVHDLTHIAQVARVMARQYKKEIGPWTEFFRILNF